MTARLGPPASSVRNCGFMSYFGSPQAHEIARSRKTYQPSHLTQPASSSLFALSMQAISRPWLHSSGRHCHGAAGVQAARDRPSTAGETEVRRPAARLWWCSARRPHNPVSWRPAPRENRCRCRRRDRPGLCPAEDPMRSPGGSDRARSPASSGNGPFREHRPCSCVPGHPPISPADTAARQSAGWPARWPPTD